VDPSQVQAASNSAYAAQQPQTVGHFLDTAGTTGLGMLKSLWNLSPPGMAVDAIKQGIQVIQTHQDPGPSEVQKTVVGLLKAHVDQAQKALDAAQNGRYSEAFGHSLAAITPMVGPAAAHVADTLAGTDPVFDKYGNVVQQGQQPDVAGALGEAAPQVAAAALPKIAEAAPAIGDAVEGAATATSGFAKGAVTTMPSYRPIMLGGITSRLLGMGYEPGAALGLATELVKNGMRGARSALADPTRTNVPYAGEVEPPSFAEPATAISGAVTPAEIALRDGKVFSKVSQEEQQLYSQIAAAENNVRSQAASGPPQTSQPIQPPNSVQPSTPAAPGLTAAQMLQQEVAARAPQAPAAAPVATAAVPESLNLTPAQMAAWQRVQQAARTLPPISTPITVGDMMQYSAPPSPEMPRFSVEPNPDATAISTPRGYAAARSHPEVTAQTAAETPIVSPVPRQPVFDTFQSQYDAQGNYLSPGARAVQLEEWNIANKGARIAQAIDKAGISLSDAQKATPEKGWPYIEKVLKQKGLIDAKETIPDESIPSILNNLWKIQKPATAGSMMQGATQ